MDSMKMGFIESENIEESGLSIAGPEDVFDDYAEEQVSGKQQTGENHSTKSQGGNVVYAYLNEVKNWPILSREEEHGFARVFQEAENEKKDLLQQWAKIFSTCIARSQLAACGDDSRAASLESPRKLLVIIDAICSFQENLSVLDEKIAQQAGSAYMCRKLSGEREQLAQQADQYCRGIDLVSLYRSGAVRCMYPFMKSRISVTVRRSLFGIIKNYLVACTASREAKDRLIRSNLRLVIGIAKKYINRGGLSLPDLIQEGNIGLIRAIEKFDYRMGNRLSTYASWWIRQTVIRAIEEKSSTIRVPIYINEKIKKLLRNSEDDATQADVAQEALNDSDNLYYALQLTKDPISLETPFSDDGSNLHECIADTAPASAVEQFADNQLHDITERLLKGLSPRDERILRMRFGVGEEVEHTLEEIGEAFQLSRERIRQIETSVLRRIRVSDESDVLRAFLCDEAV